VPIGLAAVRAGKDVYIEKPLGHTLAQNKAMLDACVKHNRIFQYGTQQRSQEIMRRGIELVLNGTIGEIERIDIWAPAVRVADRWRKSRCRMGWTTISTSVRRR
jgi:predicted dehydrogenase